MKPVFKLITLLVIVSAFVSCKESAFHEDKIFAGNLFVKADTLNTGKQIYSEYCMACHGDKGDGKGVASKGLQVPPRDFTIGIYKFGQVIAGELPNDKDFFDILKKGLHGTAMLPWDLSDGQMNAVVQYIKTFAPDVWEGKEKKTGEPIVVSGVPPFEGHSESIIERGKAVYHVVAQCQACHRGYVSYGEMNSLNKKINGEGISRSEFDPDTYKIKPQESEYGYKTIPPDFTWDSVRSAETVEELFIRLSAGVGGTAMPSWKDTISDDDIWALSYYVKYLMDLKDSPKREQFLNSIK